MKEKQPNTKDKILECSISMFNRFGIVNVRLQYIADEVGLSVGNLAYHFKTKDLIFEAIYNILEKKQKELLAELKVVPLFENINRHLQNTYSLQNQFSFFYSDTFEILRSYPLIKTKYRQYIEWFIQQIEMMIQFNISRGVFRNTLNNLDIKILAQQYWASMDLWLYQNRLRADENISEAKFLAYLWAILKPYFSEIGEVEFHQLIDNEKFNLNLFEN